MIVSYLDHAVRGDTHRPIRGGDEKHIGSTYNNSRKRKTGVIQSNNGLLEVGYLVSIPVSVLIGFALYIVPAL